MDFFRKVDYGKFIFKAVCRLFYNLSLPEMRFNTY